MEEIVDGPAERTAVPRDSSVQDRTVGGTADSPSLLRRWAGRRDERRRDALAERTAERDAAYRSASQRRSAGRSSAHTVRTAEEIAPVPEWMRRTGVWLDRTLGAVPLIAPLGLSAWFTAHVFIDAPISLPVWVALIATGALEGGAWKLSRIYEKTLLEGDSTISLRVGLGLYLGIISGLIYWHAWYQAGQTVYMGWNWIPAAACAVLSWLGIYIWGRSARYQHRVQLRRDGRIDRQAPKFAILSWLLTPLRTWHALRHAVIFRIDSPTTAVEDLRDYRAAGRPKVWPSVYAELVPRPQRDTMRDVPHGQTELAAPRLKAIPSVPSRRPALGSVPRDDGTDGTGADSSDDSGTRDDGTRDDGTDPAGVVDPEMLRLADHMLTVAAAFPDWQNDMPSVSKTVEAIAAARAKDGDTFNSRSTAAKVINALKRVARHDDPAGTLTRLRVLEEG